MTNPAAPLVGPSCLAGEWGPTQWCSVGKHDRCEHRAGGRQERGVWMPECYVTIPASPGSTLQVCPPSQPKVIRPSHVYRCPCECHHRSALPVGQLPLFEASA